MRFFSRKSRNKKKPAKSTTPQRKEGGAIVDENEGFNPYDTNPGFRQDDLGLRRRDDRKWSF